MKGLAAAQRDCGSFASCSFLPPAPQRLSGSQKCSAKHTQKKISQIVCSAVLQFDSKVFQPEKVSFADREEYIYRGGRDKYSKLADAWQGVKKIAVIGWGSQVRSVASLM